MAVFQHSELNAEKVSSPTFHQWFVDEKQGARDLRGHPYLFRAMEGPRRTFFIVVIGVWNSAEEQR
jgi:hypothetical protein